MEFEQTFLERKVDGSTTHYIGKHTYGPIHLLVKEGEDGETKNVTYLLPSKIKRQYTVTTSTNNWGNEKVRIKDEKGLLLFEGMYSPDYFFLTSENGEPFIEEDAIIRIGYNNNSPFTKDYVIPLKHVVDVAMHENEVIRGDVPLLLIVFFLFGYTAFDRKFPLFFFYLRNFLDVRDPEPSEFYLSMQRLGWKVFPIVGVILLIVAIL
ncbi:hypothetical protein ACWE42_10085 [Sutcliffiella cohnii]